MFSNRNASNVGTYIRQNTNGTITARFGSGSQTGGHTTTATISSGSWGHVAVTWNNGTTKVYVNGTLDGTVSDDTTNGNEGIYIGGLSDGGQLFTGYMDEIRISNNIRYSSNFTPSTTAFTSDANTLLLIHSDTTNASTVFIDSSAKIARLHGWAVNY